MFDKLIPNKERGQVGIETLIIFIAMILVAAVAAGVLINTAGFLQNQAKATSQDSTAQVSNQVIVISAVGNVTDTQTINTINFTIMEAPGASEIDMKGATVEFIGPNGKTTLVYNDSSSDASAGYFSVSDIKDDDNSLGDAVLNSREDRASVNVWLAGSDGTKAAELGEGDEATVRFVTQSGSQYQYVVNVPESLSSSTGGSVEV